MDRSFRNANRIEVVGLTISISGPSIDMGTMLERNRSGPGST
jgi:hypothetical protein